MRWWSLVPLLLLHRAVGLRAQTPDRWRAAAAAIRRLPPDSFPRLPARIRYALAARGCTIPQSFTEKRPHNVVTGRFARAGQHDWAVLCSRQDSSSVLIFWGGRQPAAPAELGRAADASFLEDIGGGRIRYSRLISLADTGRVHESAAAFGGAGRARLDHDGVEDAFADKASTIFYLEKGRWVLLGGSD